MLEEILYFVVFPAANREPLCREMLEEILYFVAFPAANREPLCREMLRVTDYFRDVRAARRSSQTSWSPELGAPRSLRRCRECRPCHQSRRTLELRLVAARSPHAGQSARLPPAFRPQRQARCAR